MTNQQLNERLAMALGWIPVSPDYPWLFDNPNRVGIDAPVVYGDFSPATSVDDLRKWVLPEIVSRGLGERFSVAVANIGLDENELVGAQSFLEPYFVFRALSASPPVLAAAALEVLEAGNG